MPDLDNWGKKHRNSTTPFRVDLIQEALEVFNVKEPNILDFGVGQARNWPDLLEVGFNNITGLDVSPLLLDEAKEQYPDHEFVLVKDSSNTKLPSDNYDVILLMGVLVCITALDVRFRLLKEVSRLLKPGGILYLTDFMVSDSRGKDYQEFIDTHPGELYGTYYSPRQEMNFHHMTETELRNLLKTSGFKVLKEEFPMFTSVSNSSYTGVLGLYQKPLI